MAVVRTNKITKDPLSENETIVNYELKFEFGTLIVSQITQKDDGSEEITPTMIQPWKCLPDGSRTAFVNEDDAYSWFESAKTYLV